MITPDAIIAHQSPRLEEFRIHLMKTSFLPELDCLA